MAGWNLFESEGAGCTVWKMEQRCVVLQQHSVQGVYIYTWSYGHMIFWLSTNYYITNLKLLKPCFCRPEITGLPYLRLPVGVARPFSPLQSWWSTHIGRGLPLFFSPTCCCLVRQNISRCGHCQQLSPEFRRAAELVQTREPSLGRQICNAEEGMDPKLRSLLTLLMFVWVMFLV